MKRLGIVSSWISICVAGIYIAIKLVDLFMGYRDKVDFLSLVLTTIFMIAVALYLSRQPRQTG